MTVLTKKPFQIYLRQEQLEALRLIAEKRGISIAELIRQGVDQLFVSMPVEDDPLLNIINLGDSGLGDLAQNHDRYLADEEAGQAQHE